MDNDSKEIEKEIDYIVEEWECMAKNSGEGNFYYGEKYMFSVPDSSDSRLLKVFNSSSKDSAFDTMTSMRNVDTMVAGNILQWEDR